MSLHCTFEITNKQKYTQTQYILAASELVEYGTSFKTRFILQHLSLNFSKKVSYVYDDLIKIFGRRFTTSNHGLIIIVILIILKVYR